MSDTIIVPKYVTLEERLNKTQLEVDKKMSAEMHADKTTIIDDNHPLWIAYQKAKKEKSYSTKELIKMFEDGEFDD